MIFSQAFELMKQGNKVKLPSWGGYWEWSKENHTILMHTRSGEVIPIGETYNILYTIDNILSEEWVIADEVNTTILGGVATFNFGEALKYLKRGHKIARMGWNGKGIYVQLNKAVDFEFSELCPFLTIKNVRNSFDTWVPSVSDLLAEDYIFVN